MQIAFEQVDVFTDRPFAGNALCVVPDGTGLSAEQMQAIAREMNLSETTFVLPPTDPKPRTGCGFHARQGDPLRGHPASGPPTSWPAPAGFRSRSRSRGSSSRSASARCPWISKCPAESPAA